MKKLLETGMILFSVLGFWGMIYPDLCFTEDVCAMSVEDARGGGEEDIFTSLCGAAPGKIRIRSRLLEMLKSESEGNKEWNR